MTFIPIERKNAKVTKMVVTTQIIDSEKTELINLIYKSSTDELTRLYNRRTYEDDLDKLEKDKELDKVVIVAMDVNGLKGVNDNLGHKAGDELIIGASDCMKKVFTPFGKVYRTGGDEFMAILSCDEEQVLEVSRAFEQTTAEWTGELLNHLSVSCGYVIAKQEPDLSIRELVAEADKRMYADKAAYYKRTGIERRKG